MIEYKTIKSPGEFTYIEKKSEFIGRALHIDTEEEAAEIISETGKSHPKARHTVYAYVIEPPVMRFSDDHEPAGTAGKPVLNVITKNNLEFTLITVVRYFGGILLGAGHLTGAYSKAAAGAVSNAAFAEFHPAQRLQIILPYEFYGKISQSLISPDIIPHEPIFSDNVTVELDIKAEKAPEFIKNITNITSGNAKISVVRNLYLDFFIEI
ncbi:MAG: YigZ family protein [Ruminococcus sp.]|nr:YigZ family protein [Ruminococcus sp.]